MNSIRKWFSLAVLAASLLSVTAIDSASGAISTSFEEFAPGTTAENLGIPGVQFGSPFSPNAWTVQANGQYMTLSGNILSHEGGNCAAALIIELDEPRTIVGFSYGITRPTVVLKVDGWLGNPGPGQLQFSQSYYGAYAGSPTGAREGVAHASGLAFDHLVIYAPGGCAAIDNLRITGRPSLSLDHPILDIRSG